MSQKSLYIVASLLILAGLLLIVLGLAGSELLWKLGLALVGLAMLLSLATHWVQEKESDDKKQTN